MKKIPEFTWLYVPKTIWFFLGKQRARFVGFSMILMFAYFYELVPPLLVGKIIDFFTVYSKGDSLNIFYIYVLFLGFSLIFVSLIRLKSKNVLSKIGIRLRTDARILCFEKLSSLSLQWHTKENTGNKIERITTGANSLDDWITLIYAEIFPFLASFVGILSFFVFANHVFLIFLLGYIFVFVFIQFFFNKALIRLNNQANVLKQQATGSFYEGAGNLMTIKAMGSEKQIQSRVSDNENLVREILLKSTTVNMRKWYFFQTLNGLAQIVFFLLIAQQFTSGLMSVGEILVFFTFYTKLRESGNYFDDSIRQMLEEKSKLANMMPIVLAEDFVKSGNEEFPKKWNKVEIKDGSFKYENGKHALDNFNFKFYKNEILGIVGESGSSKSTLVKVLLGLYPLKSGAFNVGKTNYYKISHNSLISNLAVVLQDTELFNMSLRENISGLREVSPELFEKAVHISKLDELVASLPDGINTLIGEKGYKLSGGERQRVGIARAICKDSQIMILDEATSSLDSKTEKHILDKLLAEFKGKKTFIIIAHRISTLRNADRVVVFEKGRIEEEGGFNELIRASGSRLGELYRMQGRK